MDSKRKEKTKTKRSVITCVSVFVNGHVSDRGYKCICVSM